MRSSCKFRDRTRKSPLLDFGSALGMGLGIFKEFFDITRYDICILQYVKQHNIFIRRAMDQNTAGCHWVWLRDVFQASVEVSGISEAMAIGF